VLSFALLFALMSAAISPFNVHVGVNRTLLLRSEQTRVVFGQVFLLSSAHLATHDETRTQLDRLWLYEARGRVILSTTSLTVHFDRARRVVQAALTATV